MPRLSTMALLTFACFSICVGATLMQHSIGQNPSLAAEQISKPACPHQADCQRLINIHNALPSKELSKKLYEKAFIASMNQQWSMAQMESECAAHLDHGGHGWKISNDGW